MESKKRIERGGNMGAGRPKNSKGGSGSYDKRRNRYVAQYYLVDN